MKQTQRPIFETSMAGNGWIVASLVTSLALSILSLFGIWLWRCCLSSSVAAGP
jgi:hypothetical protein